jgi:hypothetical protein
LNLWKKVLLDSLIQGPIQADQVIISAAPDR